MTTKRKSTAAVASAGVNFLRTLVEGSNCIFQKIDQENDVGNDAYVEFVQDERTTGCCIAVQIKSGASYVSPDGQHLILRSDQAHFEYWSSHSLPVCGVVFNPETKVAGWCDISGFLRENPKAIKRGPFQIPIPPANVLDERTFPLFQSHFLQYRNAYATDARFGEVMVKFAHRDDVQGCYDAIRSLFSFHRQRFATWYYMWSCLRNFRGHSLLRPIVARLAHIPGHGDIFWSQANLVDPAVSRPVMEFISQAIGREEVLALLECVDENGFNRGSLGQCAWSLVMAADRHIELLRSVVGDVSIPEPMRYSALWILIVEEQTKSSEAALALIAEYAGLFADSLHRGMLDEMAGSIREHRGVSLW